MPSSPPRLRPGLHVVRRDATSVQVGLDPPHRVVLPADRACLAFLESLRQGTAAEPVDDAQARTLHDLRRADLLVEHPAAPRDVPTVALHHHGFAEATSRLTKMLAHVGITVTTHPAPDLVVTCAVAPLPRALVDPWLAEGTPHLVVAGTGRPGGLRVGPLVEPGLTACLRCIDATEAADDPRRPLLVEQLATKVASPIEPLTLTLALAWAARDIARFLVGDVATTWSATVDVDEPVPQVRTWLRHPECGCCWDDLPY
ncbi:MAG: hypothetical protein WB471_11715 [Nocardioides sp.]